MRYDQIFSHLYGHNPWIVTRHNGHAAPPRDVPDAPESSPEAEAEHSEA
jgi:hypothetical protein